MADPREEAIRRHYYQPRSLMAERKNQSAERISRENARSKANGQSKKTT